MTTQISEVAKELQAALTAAAKAHEQLEAAEAKLAPLHEAALIADEAVSVLMNQYQSLTIGPIKKRGGASGPRKAYNISPESKIAATEKRTYTKGLASGMTETEAKKAGKEAAKKLAAKLGVE